MYRVISFRRQERAGLELVDQLTLSYGVCFNCIIITHIFIPVVDSIVI